MVPVPDDATQLAVWKRNDVKARRILMDESFYKEAQEEASRDDPVEWTDPIDSIVRDTVPRDIVEMDQKRKHDRIHCHEKKEEVETGSCVRVPSYLSQVQDDQLMYDSLFYESLILYTT